MRTKANLQAAPRAVGVRDLSLIKQLHLTVARSVGALIALLALVQLASAEELFGRVVSITDGDTFTLLTSGKHQIRVRLAEIDTPEARQPYGAESRKALAEMVFGKDVRVVIQTVDRYGRLVGRPYVGETDVCAELVRSGAAWAYRKYMRDDSLLSIEAEARAQRKGIWGLSEADRLPPREWRRYSQQVHPITSERECQIKGNINSRGERIYHLPGTRYYSRTIIDESRGERWFCDEAEAQAAGWRAPR